VSVCRDDQGIISLTHLAHKESCNLVSSRVSNIGLVRELYQQLLAGDLDAVRARLDANFVLRATDSLPYGGRREGADALHESMQAFLQYWRDPRFDVREFTANDDGRVVAQIELSCVSKIGLAFSTTVLESWLLVGGRVRALDVFYLDPDAALRSIHGFIS
jgi:ketosteroid isomerase-like protein